MRQPYIVTEDLLVSSWLRFAHAVLDRLVVYAVILILMFMLGFIAGVTGDDSWLSWTQEISTLTDTLITLGLSLIYYAVFESISGQTVGKIITGTIVVDYNGDRVGTGTIIKRTFCRIIPFDFLTFFNGARGMHDSIPDVYVVHKKRLQEAKRLHDDFESFGTETENPV
ncbi:MULTISPECIES: RDD family protein [unclassified Flavobacterium]|uniref:RDD family protein n=1 Tax=unclassified Flavobacterium TaxID=196869 RepID=UPI001F1319C9|nr:MULTISPECIES: RDD family protein [unclassified Flavobacterium]UMY66080.1 RDD family protein [Flavobacterium sp. HJ-32-4]